VLPLHSSMVPPHGTMRGFRLAAHWIRITLDLSGRQGSWGGVAER
jgi:hypothetical protein